MKHSAFNMILKANDKVFSGYSRHTHDPRSLQVEITNEDKALHYRQY
jgi:hypothetical protein